MDTEMEILGLTSECFDPALLLATDHFAAAVAAAVEAGARHVEPSHLLIALGRAPGSLTASLFAGAQIPVDVFLEALRPRPFTQDGPPPTAFTRRTVSAATLDVFDALPALVDERGLLAALLPRLEPAAKELLLTYGKIDLEQWIATVTTEPASPRALFDADGRLVLDAFSHGARRVLSTAAAEAAGLGRCHVGTALLLQGMAVAPNGLIEQACHFLRHDIRTLRTQLAALNGGSTSSAIQDVTLSVETIGEPLRLTLEKAATVAAERPSELIGERDLLAALLDTRGGLAAGFFRDTHVDVAGLRWYAEDYYQEPVPPQTRAAAKVPSLEESLAWFRTHLIGQAAVVERVAPRLELITRALRRGFRIGDRPLATFLFCGASGTGKTMTARLIAKVVYGSEDDVLWFEMGQFNSHESINNFIGAPPGYVGFGEGKLTNGLRDNPRRVLLFDEVEKADRRVFNALLRLLDEGRISDPAGPVRDARDSVIVLTSNLGAAEFAQLARLRARSESPGSERADQVLGPGPTTSPDAETDELAIAARLRRIIEGFFLPEFLNRIDEVILFSSFGPAELEAIAEARLLLRATEVRAQLGVEIVWEPDIPRRVAEIAAELRMDEAARGVIRCIDAVLPLLLRLLDEAEERVEKIERVRLVMDGGRLSVVNADG